MSFLDEPKLRGIAVGSPQWFAVQRQIIQSRPLTRSCYQAWYARLLEDERSVPGDGGVLLELGSGSSFLKELCPHVVTSDVCEGIAERVIDGRALPFADASVRAIFATHVFHHIPDVGQFLCEAERTLRPGGVLSLIEVAHTPFARFFFRHFHPEPYNDRTPHWSFTQADAMIDSNQALSWIVFQRDRERFEELFPTLRLRKSSFLPWCSYLVSGGVTRRSLLPGALAPAVRFFDRLLRPLDPLMSLHWHLTIAKQPSPAA